ncbi:mannonate dehydratase [Virgibacillus natechei]|uniref:Mannonate dehydratase n=1 Tax=Virgibacillus natechei TaxID=1216297 RepID=A0ABS4IEF1_9BACI|nr:mannonate dehydratase [Virgibacillus natechei]MBP1969325.1 mannonate dehydratase [Virgibacillus natechei]UZD12477.1 mannonate dehydratase [Virgibacillus natechei]
MKMVLRWFGEGNDQVPLHHMKQIPGLEGVAWALHDIPAGEVWPLDKISEIRKQADSHGLNMDVVESVNIHEDIKLGLPTRDKYIENYRTTIKNLASAGVKVICYNFMPVFDWVRTDLYKEHEDGSTSLFFEKSIIENIDPMKLVKEISLNKNYSMPGWEPERLKYLTELFKQYEGITEEDLWDHLQYFLEKIIPIAAQYDIKMAIHPDDPPFSVFGLPRIMKNKADIRRLLGLVDNPYNGLTLCSGSFGVNADNNVAEMVREFSDRIHFAHIRNAKTFGNGDFIETSHRTSDGTIDIYEIVKALHEEGFTGYVRPDHGRQIWDEECRPGYGFYDRGLGIMYLWGIWDSLVRAGKETYHVTN